MVAEAFLLSVSGASEDQLGVVLVGDDVAYTHNLAAMLERAGHPVRMAVSARMALSELQHGGPQVVVCDLGASRMQSIEVALALRESEPPPPIVAISSMPNIEQHCERLGVRHFLQHPFRFGELLEAIDRAGHLS